VKSAARLPNANGKLIDLQLFAEMAGVYDSGLRDRTSAEWSCEGSG